MSQAIVAYSFGGSLGRPGPSNVVFGQVIDSLLADNKGLVVVVQDFIELCVSRKPDLVVGEAGRYVSSEGITDELTPFLRSKGISQVLLVAHPFLHCRKCKRLLEAQGFQVERVRTGKVPFDRRNESWWVRSSFHLLLYGFLQMVFGRHGK